MSNPNHPKRALAASQLRLLLHFAKAVTIINLALSLAGLFLIWLIRPDGSPAILSRGLPPLLPSLGFLLAAGLNHRLNARQYPLYLNHRLRPRHCYLAAWLLQVLLGGVLAVVLPRLLPWLLPLAERLYHALVA